MDRRAFLRSAIGATAVSSTMVLLGSPLSRVQAAINEPGELQPDDHYLVGTFKGIDKNELIVSRPTEDGAAETRLLMTSSTFFCRRSCSEDVGKLSIGDRVECGADLDEAGRLVALWVNANARYGHGRVRKVSEGSIFIEDEHNLDALINLEVGPQTKLVSQDGYDVTDSYVDFVRVDDPVIFTGTCDSTDVRDPNVWAYLVFLDQASGGGTEATFGDQR